MFTTGSKLFLGGAVAAAVCLVLVGITTGGDLGRTATIGLAGAMVALGALSAVVLWFRDFTPSADAPRDSLPAAAAKPRRSIVPIAAALGAGMVVVGLATKATIERAGLLLLLAVVVEGVVSAIVNVRSARHA